MASGTTTVDFGAYPGKDMTSIDITGQTDILSGSLVEAWLFPADTTDHTVEEHIYEDIKIIAGNVIAGTGFTIYAVSGNTLLYGQYSVAWAYVV